MLSSPFFLESASAGSQVELSPPCSVALLNRIPNLVPNDVIPTAIFNSLFAFLNSVSKPKIFKSSQKKFEFNFFKKNCLTFRKPKRKEEMATYQGEKNSRGENHGKGTWTGGGERCAHPAWRRGAAGGD